MPTSINLEEPFSYSLYPIIIIILVIFILTIYLILITKKKNNNNNIPKPIIINTPKDINFIKTKYLKKLDIINEKLEKNNISNRVAYQKLSIIIRYFTYEVTGIKLQNCTLEDIKKINIPQVYNLVNEYYNEEFSKYPSGNVKESIQKTRKVIEKWN